jgi:Cdc6-like AAA superfamily ATPase
MMLFNQRKNGIVKDAQWLQPLSNPPNAKPLCRDEDLNEMASSLADLFTLGQGKNLFIVGKPGTGKTLCVKYLLEEIRRHARETSFPLAAVYVNAGMSRGPYHTILEIVRALGVEVPNSGVQMFRLKQHFETILREKAIVIGIDEVDALLLKEREPLVYYLNRQSRTTLILVSNRIRDASNLPERALSTLQPRLIRLSSYGVEEAKIILRERAQKTLKPGTFTDELLDPIATLASKVADIRIGFAVLLSAAHNAEQRGKPQIEAEDVEAAVRSSTILSLISKIDALEQKHKTVQKGEGNPQPDWIDSLLS